MLLPIGLQVEGNEFPLTLGESAYINCSSDLDVTRIDWISHRRGYSTRSLGLLFDQVTLDMHGAQYTCRVTSPYGVQERTITVVTEGKQGFQVSRRSIEPLH